MLANIRKVLVGLALITMSSAGLISDKLVAMVEKKPITELELIDRYEIHKKTIPGYNPPYSKVRPQLIEELCIEKMNEILWEKLSNNKIELNNDQLKAFKERYHLEEIPDQRVQSFYSAMVKKEQLTKYLVQDKIELSDYEIQYFSQQPQAWMPIGALWDFKMLESSNKITDQDIQTNTRAYHQYPAHKIRRAILTQVDWKKTNTWQFFVIDDEHIGFYLEKITLPQLLDAKYKIKLINSAKLQGMSPSEVKELYLHQSKKPEDIVITDSVIKSINDLPADVLNELSSLEANECSKPFFIGSHWYSVLLESKEDQSNIDIQENILASLKQQLLTKKTEEKLPIWYDSLKKDYYIKVLS